MINSNLFQKIVSTITVLLTMAVSAQFTFNAHNNGWVQVNGSSGVTATNVVAVEMHMSGALNYKNWSLVARVVCLL